MPVDKINPKVMEEAEKALLIQKNQENKLEEKLSEIDQGIDKLSSINDNNLDNIDRLLGEADSFMRELNVEKLEIDYSNYEQIEDISLYDESIYSIKHEEISLLDEFVVDDDISWEDYMMKVDLYAEKNNIIYNRNSYRNLLSESDQLKIKRLIEEDYKLEKANCDKYDYIIASFSGIVTGLMDAFFVGAPGKSKFGNWTDKQVDKTVLKFAKIVWKGDKHIGKKGLRKEPDSLVSAIRYLENRFKVPYDAIYASDLKLGNKKLDINPRNHHIKSLGHSPSLMGLFFSILDQFTGEASFISDGKIIRLEPVNNTFTLRGSNLPSKLFAAFFNWIGHLMSDIAGSKEIRASSYKRGMGIPAPFFELFQFLNFGKFNINSEQKTLAELSIKVFEQGYDARHSIAMSIPVVINELLIRLMWMLKSRFYHGNDWGQSNPLGHSPELRRMLLVGHGTLSIIDGVDAGIRSGGSIVNFALHLNTPAWTRFSFAAIQEIRAKFNENAVDLIKLDADLEAEWKRLYGV